MIKLEMITAAAAAAVVDVRFLITDDVTKYIQTTSLTV